MPATRPRLLVVEDEAHLQRGLKLNFELDGYRVDVAASARQAGALMLQAGPFDAVVLDVMLPDRDGFDFCRSLRDAGDFTPVLMLTARDATEDRVQGLQAGADDYLTKPFELAELLARVRSLLRRRGWERRQQDHSVPRLQLGQVEVDFEAREARRGDALLHFTKLEFDLLHYFALHPGRVIAREELLSEVWKLDGHANARMVDNFIVRLRRHFEADPSQPCHFVSVRGSGYKFMPPDT
ncbi:MAG: response regulator transcription factor [Polyangiales bacterium]